MPARVLSASDNGIQALPVKVEPNSGLEVFVMDGDEQKTFR